MSHTYINPENINLFYCLSLISFSDQGKKYHIQSLIFPWKPSQPWSHALSIPVLVLSGDGENCPQLGWFPLSSFWIGKDVQLAKINSTTLSKCSISTAVRLLHSVLQLVLGSTALSNSRWSANIAVCLAPPLPTYSINVVIHGEYLRNCKRNPWNQGRALPLPHRCI